MQRDMLVLKVILYRYEDATVYRIEKCIYYAVFLKFTKKK